MNSSLSTPIKKNNPAALTAFILGLLSLVLYAIGIVPLAAIAAAVLGFGTFDERRHKCKWMAHWGYCLGMFYVWKNAFDNGHEGPGAILLLLGFGAYGIYLYVKRNQLSEHRHPHTESASADEPIDVEFRPASKTNPSPQTRAVFALPDETGRIDTRDAVAQPGAETDDAAESAAASEKAERASGAADDDGQSNAASARHDQGSASPASSAQSNDASTNQPAAPVSDPLIGWILGAGVILIVVVVVFILNNDSTRRDMVKSSGSAAASPAPSGSVPSNGGLLNDDERRRVEQRLIGRWMPPARDAQSFDIVCLPNGEARLLEFSRNPAGEHIATRGYDGTFTPESEHEVRFVFRGIRPNNEDGQINGELIDDETLAIPNRGGPEEPAASGGYRFTTLTKARSNDRPAVADRRESPAKPMEAKAPKPVTPAKQPPQSALDAIKRGLEHYELKQWELAVVEFTDAIALSPGYVITYWDRAAALNELGKYQAAYNDCTAAIQLDPTCSPAFSNRAKALIGLKRYSEAAEDASEALAIDPGNAWGHFYLALAIELRLTLNTEEFADAPEALKIASKEYKVAASLLSEAEHARLETWRKAIIVDSTKKRTASPER